MGFTYPFLSDANAEVIRRYDLLHVGSGPRHSDIARPAEFLIDTSGTVRWMNLTESVAVRARPEQVLKAFDELNGSPTVKLERVPHVMKKLWWQPCRLRFVRDSHATRVPPQNTT